MIVYDATDAIAGRLAAAAAKKALQGEEVAIVNAGKAMISGRTEEIVQKYARRRTQQNKGDPDKSPKWPRRPDYLLKKIIRGMLPKHSGRGKQALRRIKAYNGVPKELEGKAQKFTATASSLQCNAISIEEICKVL
ncbi:MAG: 50S ribosomal protein L13 [Candidatus Micrarchaeota archaeon]